MSVAQQLFTHCQQKNIAASDFESSFWSLPNQPNAGVDHFCMAAYLSIVAIAKSGYGPLARLGDGQLPTHGCLSLREAIGQKQPVVTSLNQAAFSQH